MSPLPKKQMSKLYFKSISKVVKDAFQDYCKAHGITMTTAIERLMKKAVVEDLKLENEDELYRVDE